MSEVASATSNASGLAAPATEVITASTNLAKAPPQDTPESLGEMKKAAHLKFDEAAKLRKEAQADRIEAEKIRKEALQSKTQVEQFIELCKTNPEKLKDIYGEEIAFKIAEDLLYSKYQNDKLSPEERADRAERAKEKEELEDYRKQKKDREENETKTKREEMITEQANHIDEMISNAIKENNLPKTPRTVKRIAEYLEAQLSAELELDPASVVSSVHEERHEEAVDYIKSLSPQQLFEEFPSLVKTIREFDMQESSKVPSFQSGFSKPKTEGNGALKPKEAKSIDGFFKDLEKRIG